MIDRLKRVSDLLTRVFGFGGIISVALLTLLVSLSSVSRYALNFPIHFMPDGAAVLLASSYFLGLAYVFRQGGHVRITLVLNKLSLRARSYMEAICDLIALIFLIVLAKESISYTILGFQLGCRTDTAFLYLPPWMAGVSLGVLVFAMAVFTDFVIRIQYILGKRKGEKEKEVVVMGST